MRCIEEKCGVLFVHGIAGNSHIFDFLRPLVPEVCEVRSLTLAGHGGNALDFSRATMARWKAQVKEAVDDMATRCSRIYAVGHSMGCLLVMQQASEGRVHALFLMNPPLRLRITRRLFSNPLKVALGLTGRDAVASAAKDAYGVSIDPNPLHYNGWPKRYFELFAEIRRVRKTVVPAVWCPVSAVLAGNDEMVAPTAGKYFSALPQAEVMLLPESHHYYYTPADREIIGSTFGRHLREVLNKP